MQAKVLERKILNFFQVPSVVTNQGEEAEKLLKERRSLWISAISRDDSGVDPGFYVSDLHELN